MEKIICDACGKENTAIKLTVQVIKLDKILPDGQFLADLFSLDTHVNERCLNETIQKLAENVKILLKNMEKLSENG